MLLAKRRYTPMIEENPLGSFLRAHRGRLAPREVGLPVHGHRRVSGLRREEVAVRAGISVEYYIRLEQGRERNPSPQVCESLARALALNADAAAHLHSLARPKAHTECTHSRDGIPDGSVRLLHALNLPAVIQNRFMDVIA